MSELTITVTVPYETDDDLRRLSELLQYADRQLTDYAQERIKWHSERHTLLDNTLLFIQRPDDYKDRMGTEYLLMRAWIAARERASRVVFGAAYKVIQVLNEGKEQ